MARQTVARRFEDRVRFNWGFHAGVSDERTGYVALWRRGPRDTHYDRVYVSGYYAGMDAAKLGEPTFTSDVRWLAYRAACDRAKAAR